MGLMTTAMKDRHYVIFRKAPSHGLDLGRHVRLKGSIVPDWLQESATQTNDPFPDNPDAIWDVNGEEEVATARAVAEHVAASMRPDCRLTKEALWRKLPWTKTPELYALAVGNYGFPQPSTETAGFSFREIANHWSEQAVDRWLAETRAKIAQLQVFVS